MLQINRERSLTIFLVLLLAVTLVITWINQNRLSQATFKNQSLAQENQSLKQTNARLTAQIEALEKEKKRTQTLLPEEILARTLQQKGLTEAKIKEDLLKHADLVQAKAVLGGTMFFSEASVRILTDKWVIAEFEDGHIYGYAFLKYEVKSGKLAWTLIDSYVFQGQ